MTYLRISTLMVLSAMPFACAAGPDAGSALSPGIHTGQIAERGDTLRYRLFIPDTAHRDARPPLLMMLHGCTQDAEDIARGTRMDAAASELGIAVVYAEQSPEAHPMRCWNWYLPEHQRRDSGELAMLAALAERVSGEIGSDPDRFYVAGISAGGAAALAFTTAYPERVAAVAVHSAIPFGVALSQEEALRVMQRGPGMESEALADLALEGMDPTPRAVPLIAFHGLADAVVHPDNVDAIADQWSGLHARLRQRELRRHTRTEMHDGRAVEVTTIGTAGSPASVEVWKVDALGHAWSGGSPAGTYTDPEGPDATREILRFLLSHRR